MDCGWRGAGFTLSLSWGWALGCCICSEQWDSLQFFSVFTENFFQKFKDQTWRMYVAYLQDKDLSMYLLSLNNNLVCSGLLFPIFLFIFSPRFRHLWRLFNSGRFCQHSVQKNSIIGKSQTRFCWETSSVTSKNWEKPNLVKYYVLVSRVV